MNIKMTSTMTKHLRIDLLNITGYFQINIKMFPIEIGY